MTTTIATELEVTFDPRPGMLVSSLRHRGAELLGPLGIPLLHPWANRLSSDHYVALGRAGHVPADAPRDDHGLSIHGLLRPWRVWDATARTLYAELEYGDCPAFPFAHRLAVEAVLRGRRLEVTTVVTALEDHPVPVSFGYHPYFQLPGVPRRAWRVTLPARRHAELDLDNVPTGRVWPRSPSWTGELGSRTFDDAYLGIADGSWFALEGGGRRVEVHFDAGYPVAQVFAPATADVVCFEPMTAPVDALVRGQAPAARDYTATFTVMVS